MRILKLAFGLFQKKPDPLEVFTKAVVAKYSSGNTSLQNSQLGYITQEKAEEIKAKACSLKISF